MAIPPRPIASTPYAGERETVDARGTRGLECRCRRGHGRARGDDIVDQQNALAPHGKYDLVGAEGLGQAVGAAEFALVG